MTIRGAIPLLAITLVLLGARPSPAQTPPAPGVIQGTIVTDVDEPLPGATVVIRSARDSAVVRSLPTGADGGFRVTGLRQGTYLLHASHVGYRPSTRSPITVTVASPVVSLGSIRLRRTAVALEAVEVRAERPEVVLAPDRTVYSTHDMPVAAGGMATDVLQAIPELEVDTDGSVQLRGAAPQIYVNGRPAPMQGEALQLFLQQFPADRIDRIEVIPNPSARFEAEGAAGIINIVLKRNTNLGLSGNAFINGGTQGNFGSGVNLTYQQGPLTLFGGGFLRLSRNDDARYDFRQNLRADPVTFLEQDGWSERLGSSASANLTAEVKLGERSTLWSELQAFRRGRDEDALVAYTHLSADSVVTQRYDRVTAGNVVGLDTEWVAGFRHVIEQRRHEFEAQLQWERGRGDDESRIRRLFLTPAGGESSLPVELTLEDEAEAERELEFRLDYIRPLGQIGQAEIGYRGDFERTESRRIRRVYESETASDPTSLLDNGFAHDETFHSGYLTLMRTFGRMGVQLGVRAEQADTRLTVPDGETFDKNYVSLFPNGNLRFDAGGGRELRLSYSKRIRRPREWVLNPINSSSDPLNRRVGNPELDPAYTHNVSLDASWSAGMGTLRISPFYRHSENNWTEIKTVDDAGVSTVTWENLATVRNYGASLSANLRRVGAMSGFVSVSGYREERDASNLAPSYSGASFQWSARSSLQARLTEETNLQGMVFYRPARDVPQGRYGSMLMTQFGLRHRLMENRVSLNLNVRDPFNLARSRFETRDETHVQVGRTTPSMRSIVLSLSYSFGRPPRSARERNREDPGEQEAEAEQVIR